MKRWGRRGRRRRDIVRSQSQPVKLGSNSCLPLHHFPNDVPVTETTARLQRGCPAFLPACTDWMKLRKEALLGFVVADNLKMEREAIVALKSLDADTCSRVSPDHLPGTIKLTDETLSRLAHLLKSGCSIQLACDEVRTRALAWTLCPPSPVLLVHRNTSLSDWRFSNVFLPLGRPCARRRCTEHIL
jgi:hypothetical protein